MIERTALLKRRVAPRRSTAAACALLLALLSSCGRKAAPSRPLPAPLLVEVSGCAAVMRAGTCVVGPDATVRLFVASRAVATFAAAGAPIEAETLATFDDGRLYALRIPDGARRVNVTASEGERAAEATVDLAHEPSRLWVDEGRARSERGDRDGALAIYDAHLNDEGDGAALAAGLGARVELARGRVDASVARFRDAIAKDVAAGRRSDAVDDSLALAFALAQRSHRYAEARATLEATEALVEGYPDGLARTPYYWGVLASEMGDRRDALRRLRDAEKRATRLGLARLARQARGAIAIELDYLGRFEDALEIRRAQERLLAGTSDACGRLAVRSGMGFGLLMLAARGGADRRRVDEARAVLEQAHEELACADDYLHATTLGHLAFAALLSGRPEDAASSLASARARVREPPLSEAFFWLDLEARIALARRDPARALAVAGELEQRARAAHLPSYAWSALVRRGAALEAKGRAREALDAYARAEDQLDDAELAIPIGEGRARFVVEREQSATAGITLLVASGRASEAFAWARRARRRVLEGLEVARRVARAGGADRARWDATIAHYVRERAAMDEEAAADWTLPIAELASAQRRRSARDAAMRGAVEELLSVLSGDAPAPKGRPSAPAPGELVLLFHPVAAGYVAMAADAGAVRVFHVPAVDPKASPEELTRLLLAPARAPIAKASRVRLLLPGALASIDVHALPYEGAPLIARLPVEYGLDLTPAPNDDPAAPRAIVIGDPQANLPEARREAQAVADALRAHIGRVDLLEAEAATRAGAIEAIDGAALFHYAGHAVFEGEDGWDSALPLAAGAKLLVADALAMKRVPARVILSGCRAAGTSSDSPGEALGIAQAFLVAGTDTVIAPTRDIDDAQSARLAARLYEELRADPALDLARAARAALLRTRNAEPAGDWSNVRVLRR